MQRHKCSTKRSMTNIIIFIGIKLVSPSSDPRSSKRGERKIGDGHDHQEPSDSSVDHAAGLNV